MTTISEVKSWLESEYSVEAEIISSANDSKHFGTLLFEVANNRLLRVLNTQNFGKYKESEIDVAYTLFEKLRASNLLSDVVEFDYVINEQTIHMLRHLPKLTTINCELEDDMSYLSEIKNLDSISLHILKTSPDNLDLPHQVTKLGIFSSTDNNKRVSIRPLHQIVEFSYYERRSDKNSVDISQMVNLKSLELMENNSDDIVNYDFSSNKELSKVAIYNLSGLSYIGDYSNERRSILNIELGIKTSSLSVYGYDIGNSNISSLEDLEILNLRNSTSHDNILTELSRLRKIQRIYIDDTNLNTEKIQENHSIELLSLNKSNIRCIDFVSKLFNLRTLDVSNNPIDRLPPRLPEKLHKVNISGCNIINIPKEIASSFHLDIPNGGSEKNSEKRIIIYENPIQNPPYEIISQGKSALDEYYSSMEGATTTLNEAKIIFVGDGAAGKTSLMKRLVNNDFDEKESQTDGIEIMNYKVQLEDDSCINAAIWDFGGQQILQATHQLFLSKRSIYVLVVEDRKNDLHKDQDIEQWLTQINSLGGKPPIFVVKNKIDENPNSDIQSNRLKNKFPNILGFYEVSCLERKGLDKLSSALNKCLTDLPMRKMELPQNWLNVKNEIKSQARTHDLLQLNTYTDICNKHNIKSKTAREILLRLLHDLGEVIAFEQLKKHNTAILEPTWITEGIYGIIRSEVLANNNGVITLNNAQLALDSYSDKPERFENKASYILDAMETFQLCHRTMESNTYLIPTLLPPQIDTSELDIEFSHTKSIRFIFKFEKLLPPSFMPMLLVKIHEWIYGDKRWRTGAVLTPPHLKAQAKLDLAKVERELSIEIIGKDRRDLFINLRSIINELVDKLATKTGVGLEELIPLSDSNEAVGYTELIGLKSMGESVYQSGKLGRSFNINDLLGEIEAPLDTKRALETLIAANPNGIVNIMHNENTNTNSATGGNAVNTNTSNTSQTQDTKVTATSTSIAEIKQELRAFKGQSEFIIEDIEEEIDNLTDSDRKLKEFAVKECQKVTQAINTLESEVEDQESAEKNLKHFSRVQNFLEGALKKTNSVGKVIDQAGNLYNQVESLATKYNDIAAKFSMPIAVGLGLS